MNPLPAMKMALEALEYDAACGESGRCASCSGYEHHDDCSIGKSILALTEAIEQMEKATPVAWMIDPTKSIAHKDLGRDVTFLKPINKPDWKITPLYALDLKEK